MGKDIIVNATAEESKVAILDNNKLDEFYVERTIARRLVGSVYKGRVESVMSGIGAAFVNIGLEKNGFLYIDDVLEEGSSYSDIVKEEMGGSFKKKDLPHGEKKITDVLKKGQEILVQIVKEPIGTKGARLSAHITLPGRYLVFMAHDTHTGISRKIADQKERKRLKTVIEQLNVPKDVGVIARTAAANHSRDELKREFSHQYSLYRHIEKIASKKSAPSLIHEEYGLIQRMARDNFSESTNSMVVDSRLEFKKTLSLLRAISPKMRAKLKFYKGHIPIFEKYNIAEEIEKIYKRRVKLRSKGHIVIEQTESLVAIDVNTGGFGGKNLEDTAFTVNKEAALEIARQLKLRDIGGIIVIDFVDMEERGHRDAVFHTLITAMKQDKARSKVLGFSSIGLVELTRQRMRRSLEGVSYQSCPYCSGRGTVKSALTMSIELIRQLEKKLKTVRHKRVELVVSPALKEYLLKSYTSTLKALARSSRCRIAFAEDAHLHIEDCSINVK